MGNWWRRLDVFFHGLRTTEPERRPDSVTSSANGGDMATKSRAHSEEAWRNAKKICRLNDRQVEMARRLGTNPNKLPGLRATPQQRWKLPVGSVHRGSATGSGSVAMPTTMTRMCRSRARASTRAGGTSPECGAVGRPRLLSHHSRRRSTEVARAGHGGWRNPNEGERGTPERRLRRCRRFRFRPARRVGRLRGNAIWSPPSTTRS